MNKADFLAVMKRVALAYGAKPSDGQLDEYYAEVGNHNVEHLRAAEKELKRLKYFPKLYEIENAVLDASRKNRPSPDLLAAIPAHSSFVDRMCARKFAETLRKSRGDKLVSGWPTDEMTTYIQKVKTVANRIKDGDLTEEQAIRTLRAIE